MSAFYEEIYRAVRAIPPGRVTTYGTIAAMVGRPMAARAVGYALRALPEGSDVPWHRVINAQGRISLTARHPHETDFQRHRLEREGIVFDVEDRVDLHTYGWAGRLPDPGASPRD
ncbi:Methylated-DNA--protein-cysteine methyltransferase [compost metagenome]